MAEAAAEMEHAFGSVATTIARSTADLLQMEGDKSGAAHWGSVAALLSRLRQAAST